MAAFEKVKNGVTSSSFCLWKGFCGYKLHPISSSSLSHYLPFTIYQLPFTNNHLPFTIYHLPFTIYQSTFYQLPITIYNLPFTIYHLL